MTRYLKQLNDWRRRTFWQHRWDYRNPYDRTCAVCGRHEVQHSWSMAPADWRRGWWEVFHEGEAYKHYLPPAQWPHAAEPPGSAA